MTLVHKTVGAAFTGLPKQQNETSYDLQNLKIKEKVQNGRDQRSQKIKLFALKTAPKNVP